jgi:hypothetical protein
MKKRWYDIIFLIWLYLLVKIPYKYTCIVTGAHQVLIVWGHSKACYVLQVFGNYWYGYTWMCLEIMNHSWSKTWYFNENNLEQNLLEGHKSFPRFPNKYNCRSYSYKDNSQNWAYWFYSIDSFWKRLSFFKLEKKLLNKTHTYFFSLQIPISNVRFVMNCAQHVIAFQKVQTLCYSARVFEGL